MLQTMIDKGDLDVEQALATYPGSEKQFALLKEEKCAAISAINNKDFLLRDYPFEVCMTPFPVLEDESIAVVGGDNRIAVNPNSKHLEETLLILETVFSVEG